MSSEYLTRIVNILYWIKSNLNKNTAKFKNNEIMSW